MILPRVNSALATQRRAVRRNEPDLALLHALGFRAAGRPQGCRTGAATDVVIDVVTGGKPENGPSVNQLRRRLGSWYRGEIRAAAGPVPPDVHDFPAMLQELAAISRAVSKRLPERVNEVIRELIAERATGEPEDALELNGETTTSA